MRFLIVAAFFISASVRAVAAPNEDGLETWDKIFEIVSHPRCANCHVGADNKPRWSGPAYEAAYGLEPGGWMYHGMNINADDSRIGIMTLPCSSCHQHENSDKPHGPPGAHVWALPPLEMEWFGKSSAEVCVRMKSEESNGGRSFEDLAGHIEHDELVHWGWEPGPGREPAPYSREHAAQMIRDWAAAGAPCPEGALPIEDYLNNANAN